MVPVVEHEQLLQGRRNADASLAGCCKDFVTRDRSQIAAVLVDMNSFGIGELDAVASILRQRW